MEEYREDAGDKQIKVRMVQRNKVTHDLLEAGVGNLPHSTQATIPKRRSEQGARNTHPRKSTAGTSGIRGPGPTIQDKNHKVHDHLRIPILMSI